MKNPTIARRTIFGFSTLLIIAAVSGIFAYSRLVGTEGVSAKSERGAGMSATVSRRLCGQGNGIDRINTAVTQPTAVVSKKLVTAGDDDFFAGLSSEEGNG